MKTNVLKVLIFNFLTLALSCHWREFSLSLNFLRELKEVKFKGDAYFHYKDYSKFSRELEKLYKHSMHLIEMEKSKSEIEKSENKIIQSTNSSLSKWAYKPLFIDKQFYKMEFKYDKVKNKSFAILGYSELKKHVKNLEELNKKDYIEFSLKAYVLIKENFINFFYNITRIIQYRNKYGVKEFNNINSDIDILTFKKLIAKGVKILVYHFPIFYKYLAYLFEDADQYFD